jgi:hypothetical protein
MRIPIGQPAPQLIVYRPQKPEGKLPLPTMGGSDSPGVAMKSILEARMPVRGGL